jgi:NAD+ diphosphatase
MPRFIRAYPPAGPPAHPAPLLLPFVGDDLLCQANGTLLTGEAPDTALYLGTLEGVPCLAFPAEAPPDDDQAEPELRPRSLRELFGFLGDDEWGLAGYASQLLRWTRNSRFCPACGGPTPRHDGWGVKCDACGFSHYPPATPAVLCLVHDGADRILLATKEGWGKRYSILAGFTEPGESLEDTCLRECAEEAGITVVSPRYDGSQPWPFPHQLMVAFWAQADPAQPIVLDTEELKEARWFTVDELEETLLPGAISLSRQTIDRWIASRGR